MSYKFKVSESFAEGLQRISAAQLARAGQLLQTSNDVHKSVHEVRKTLKRLRALLALYRDGIDPGDYRQIDHRLRDIGRVLAGTRDIQAMLDSLEQLERRFGRSGIGRSLEALRTELEARHTDASTVEVASGVGNADVSGSLADIGRKIESLELPQEGFEAIRKGLERTYREARRRHASAYEPTEDADGSAENFHEWRKWLQRHWRHMQLLSPAWPLEVRGRAQLSRAVSEIIGQDHDLHVLETYLLASGRTYGTAAQLKAAQAMCRKLQAELRASVHLDGERLFLESPRAFSKRLERYWSLACRNKHTFAAGIVAAKTD